jgi:hypothetical protein
MRGLLSTLLMCALVAPAAAQAKKQPGSPTPAPSPPADTKADKNEKKKDPAPNNKVKNFDFNALDLNGRMRSPQLLYFLERANEELERASLEKRSFIPHMVRSVEEEKL